MAPRANWKGYLKVAEVSCQVSLYTAASTGERIAFHTLNRETGHRVRRQFIDSETGKPVDTDAQVKGYETGKGEYVVLEPEDIAASVPESDKTLSVEAFVACDEIDRVYLDRPYYLAPSTPVASEAFALLREGMRKKNVAAIARTVLFRRMRTVLLRACQHGLIAHTLNFDYEVRPAQAVFSGIPEIKITGEMLDLAKHIITTKLGRFDPTTFDDRYEAALAEVVKAKLEGRPVKARAAPKPEKVVDLMAALRQSAKAAGRATRKSASDTGGRRAEPARAKSAAKASKKGPSDHSARRKAS